MKLRRISVKHFVGATAIAVAALSMTLPGVSGIFGSGNGSVEANGGDSHGWFMDLGDVEGDVMHDGYQGWTNVSSVTVSIDKPAEGLTGESRERGSAQFNDIIVTKELDSTSMKLMEIALTGQVLPMVELHLTTSGDKGPQPYLKYRLYNVSLTSYSFSDGSDDSPIERISMNISRIEATYVEQNSSGGEKGSRVMGWDVERAVATN